MMSERHYDWNQVHEAVRCRFVCRHCGAVIDQDYVFIPGKMETSRHMLEHERCFACQTWCDVAESIGTESSAFVIVGGECWEARPAVNPEQLRRSRGLGVGYGGQVARIRYHDGRYVETNDLWHLGRIPEIWRMLLPDNAVFLRLVEDKSWFKGAILAPKAIAQH